MSRRLLLALAALSVFVAAAAPVRALDLEDDLERVARKAAEVSAQMSTASDNRSNVATNIITTESRLNDLLVDVGRTRLQLTVVQDQLVGQKALLVAAREQLQSLHAELEVTQEELDRGEERGRRVGA